MTSLNQSSTQEVKNSTQEIFLVLGIAIVLTNGLFCVLVVYQSILKQYAYVFYIWCLAISTTLYGIVLCFGDNEISIEKCAFKLYFLHFVFCFTLLETLIIIFDRFKATNSRRAYNRHSRSSQRYVFVTVTLATCFIYSFTLFMASPRSEHIQHCRLDTVFLDRGSLIDTGFNVVNLVVFSIVVVMSVMTFWRLKKHINDNKRLVQPSIASREDDVGQPSLLRSLQMPRHSVIRLKTSAFDRERRLLSVPPDLKEEESHDIVSNESPDSPTHGSFNECSSDKPAHEIETEAISDLLSVQRFSSESADENQNPNFNMDTIEQTSLTDNARNRYTSYQVHDRLKYIQRFPDNMGVHEVVIDTMLTESNPLLERRSSSTIYTMRKSNLYSTRKESSYSPKLGKSVFQTTKPVFVTEATEKNDVINDNYDDSYKIFQSKKSSFHEIGDAFRTFARKVSESNTGLEKRRTYPYIINPLEKSSGDQKIKRSRSFSSLMENNISSQPGSSHQDINESCTGNRISIDPSVATTKGCMKGVEKAEKSDSQASTANLTYQSRKLTVFTIMRTHSRSQSSQTGNKSSILFKKALDTVIVFFLSQCLCFCPVIVTGIFRVTGLSNEDIDTSAHCLACIVMALNPFLYIWRFPILRSRRLKKSKVAPEGRKLTNTIRPHDKSFSNTYV